MMKKEALIYVGFHIDFTEPNLLSNSNGHRLHLIAGALFKELGAYKMQIGISEYRNKMIIDI